MATQQQILRLRRVDVRSEHLLLNVTKKGPKDLDLKFIGTDQQHLYHGSIKESSVKSLQATNFSGNLQDFKTVISYVLLHQRPEGPLPELLQGAEAVAAISGTTVTITVRKSIGGITQKLATIELEQDDAKEEVIFPEWVDNAVATSDDLRAELETLQTSVETQKQQLAQLNSSLDELVKVKKEHEDELLSKFAALLNEKKLKIRDQQRLLSGANTDVEMTEDVEHETRPTGKGRRATASRGGKRKAKEPAPVLDEDEDEDDAATENGTAADDDSEGRRRQETPETDDNDVTEDELDVPGASKKSMNTPEDSQTTHRMATKQSQQTSQRMDMDEESPPPTHRKALPTRKANSPTPPPSANSKVGQDEDDETDDEL